MVGDAADGVGQPSRRVDTVELRSLDEAVDVGGTVPALVRTCEQPVLVTDGERADGALGRVVDLEAAVARIAGQRRPAGECILMGEPSGVEVLIFRPGRVPGAAIGRRGQCGGGDERDGWCEGRTRWERLALVGGVAHPRGTTWNGAGGCVIVSQSRHETFSRTVWTIFHALGITSSVSVTSLPSLDRREPPQAGQEYGAGMTTRSRGRCAGERLSDRTLPLEDSDARPGRGGSGREIVLAGVGLEILKLQLHLLEQAAAALGAGAILLAPEPGDLKLEVRDHRLVALARRGVGQARLGFVGTLERGYEQRLERFEIVQV